jgi:3-methyl-2-oxobutanoate hydroxymethyltransferase
MSLQPKTHNRLTIADIAARNGKDPIVVLTAYGAPMATLLDPHVDMLLVGDSLGMVLYGFDSTLPVTLEMMIAHTAAVVRGSKRALVIADMPFGSYQASPEQAFIACAEMLSRTGCGAVKLEGGCEMAETVKMLTDRGIPVMSHIGLKPQHVHTSAGYKAQGKTDIDRTRIMEDARACEEAGAFALLIEATEESLARAITERALIPTIGIGASPACDGQVLVSEDMLGLFEQTPRFVEQFGQMRTLISHGVEAYANAVRTRQFPAQKHCFVIGKSSDS